MFQFQCSLSLPFLACQYYTVDYCIFVSLYSGNKSVRGCMAGVQGRVSWWNKLRSSSTVPFFGRSAGWSSGEAFGRHKEQYSTVHECCSTCLSNYGSCTRRRYVMAPAPQPQKAINTRVPSDSGSCWSCVGVGVWLVGEIQSVWCTSDWQPRNRLQTSDSAPGRRSPLGSVEIPRRSLQ